MVTNSMAAPKGVDIDLLIDGNSRYTPYRCNC